MSKDIQTLTTKKCGQNVWYVCFSLRCHLEWYTLNNNHIVRPWSDGYPGGSSRGQHPAVDVQPMILVESGQLIEDLGCHQSSTFKAFGIHKIKGYQHHFGTHWGSHHLRPQPFSHHFRTQPKRTPVPIKVFPSRNHHFKSTLRLPPWNIMDKPV